MTKIAQVRQAVAEGHVTARSVAEVTGLPLSRVTSLLYLLTRRGAIEKAEYVAVSGPRGRRGGPHFYWRYRLIDGPALDGPPPDDLPAEVIERRLQALEAAQRPRWGA